MLYPQKRISGVSRAASGLPYHCLVRTAKVKTCDLTAEVKSTDWYPYSLLVNPRDLAELTEVCSALALGVVFYSREYNLNLRSGI